MIGDSPVSVGAQWVRARLGRTPRFLCSMAPHSILSHLGLGCLKTGFCTNKHVRSVSQGKVMVDVGFWGGMVPANSHDTGELNAMLRDGALGFKSFLSPSGACRTERV